MFCLIPLLLFVSNALALPAAEKIYYDLADAEKHFSDFIQQHEKKYESAEEYNKRLKIFKSTLERINYMNKNQEALFGVYDFADLSYEEFAKTHFGFNPSTPTNDTKVTAVKKEWIVNAPDSLDYRDQNLVTPVKNQGHCMSCFVFAAIGNIEGQYAKMHNELLSLSEQQGLDCDTVQTDNCEHGGQSIHVINSLAQLGGSMLEDDYPYTAQNGQCQTDGNKVKAKVLSGQLISTPTEEELKGALVQYGPLAIALHMPGGEYYGDVWSPDNCNGRLNHAVLLVGYGTSGSGKQYWLIKNSWGSGWGEQGYFRLERGKGYCGIGTEDTTTALVE